MKFFDNTRTVDGCVIAFIATLVVVFFTIFMWLFYMKSTCSLCKERHPAWQVMEINADNNVTFKICRKCALEVFEEKINWHEKASDSLCN